MPEQESRSETVTIERKFLREHLYLAEQATVGHMPVVPGDSWAFHYPIDSEQRTTILQGLIEGKIDPTQAAPQLKPDGLTYDIHEIESASLSTMIGKIRDITAKASYYDYDRFAHFVSGMHGTGLDAGTAEAIYDRIAQSRIRKIFLDSYGPTGREQINKAMSSEITQTVGNFPNLPSGERIFEALKIHWASQDLISVPSAHAEKIISQLNPGEKEVFDTIKDPYRKFVQSGSASSYEDLTSAVKSALEASAQEADQPTEEFPAPEMEDYTEDLQEMPPPQTPEDPGIPEEDQDEYKTPERMSKESVLFFVTPSGASTAPMLGYYPKGRKSYYDKATKTWSKQKVTTPYNQLIPGDERQTITSAGEVSGDLIAIPVPNSYALDVSSLKTSGGRPDIFRDQNGCFYIRPHGSCKFSIDFLKEPTLFTNSPIPDDTKPLYDGELSIQTENFIKSLTGTNIDKALAAQRYLQSHHFYPADGNLNIAQALQKRLRDATPETYFQILDQSKYLECYSAHNLFIAMLRKAGVPTRLVIGDLIQKITNGKAQIDTLTGHAWAEVWDGTKWIRIDSTPKPEHQQDQDQQGQQADDGGQDQSQSGEDQEGQPKEGKQEGQPQEGEGEGKQEGQPTEGQGQGQGQTPRPDMKFQQNQQGQSQEASDQQMQQGQQSLEKAQQQMEQIQQKKQQLEKQMQKAQSFKDLEKLKEQAQKADMFDEMKQEIEDKIKAAEEAKKEAMKEILKEMGEDGFIEEGKSEKLLEKIENGQPSDLDRIEHQIAVEAALFNEYQEIRERVMPKVDEWFQYFVARLPKEQEVDIDEYSLTTGGRLNVRAAMRPTNLYLGRVMNPRVVRSSEKPLFLASVKVDWSRSVADPTIGDPEKKKAAEELCVFYCELFDRIVHTYGYTRFALDIFHDKVVPIKDFDQDYSSSLRYQYQDGIKSTVKVKLMKAFHTEGGTNILPALKHSAQILNDETRDYPGYMSAFYFIGDGEDSNRNPRHTQRMRAFVENHSPENGFGPHLKSAIFLGTEGEKRALAEIFGDDDTIVCPNFDEVIEKAMLKFDENVQDYMHGKLQ